MTVSDVINTITKTLHNEFGNDFKYYVEIIPQNSNKPCFVVSTLLDLINAKSPVLYDRTIPIIIHYFTNANKSILDNFNVAERLWDCLEYITNDEIILRGRDISWEIVENVLQFSITYKFKIRKIINNSLMETGTYNNSPIKQKG